MDGQRHKQLLWRSFCDCSSIYTPPQSDLGERLWLAHNQLSCLESGRQAREGEVEGFLWKAPEMASCKYTCFSSELPEGSKAPDVGWAFYLGLPLSLTRSTLQGDGYYYLCQSSTLSMGTGSSAQLWEEVQCWWLPSCWGQVGDMGAS